MLIRAIALALALGAIAAAGPAAAAITTVRGEVVSVECALTKGEAGRGEAHGPCAMDCARRGDPMAILADDGLYLIVGDYAAHANARLLDFVAKRVEAKGTIAVEDGRKTINVAAMMVLKDPPPPGRR
ncbi:MAG: hypothetical protein AB7O93_24010 [Vicinamibacterales bacterium]